MKTTFERGQLNAQDDLNENFKEINEFFEKNATALVRGTGIDTIQKDKQKFFDEFVYEFYREGNIVCFEARFKSNSTTEIKYHTTVVEVPEGFRFPTDLVFGKPLQVDQWTMPQGSSAGIAILDGGIYSIKLATDRTGNHYVSGQWRTEDEFPKI